jgi:hypothetical protein
MCIEMDKYTPNRARFYVRKKYTTFSIEQIVALRSVKKKIPGELRFRS